MGVLVTGEGWDCVGESGLPFFPPVRSTAGTVRVGGSGGERFCGRSSLGLLTFPPGDL